MPESANISIVITDKSPEVLAALPRAIERALWSMGAAAEGHAKGGAPVDTGRLRNSITHEEDITRTTIGSNVEYAAAQELGTSRGIRGKHYLKNAVANNTGEYKSIIQASMTNV